jgi:hypothetical protein
MPSIFADLSTMPSDTISDRIWYLGNGIIVHGDSVMHIYNDDGDFLVKLIVISDFGCLDSLSRIISIYTQPTADFIFNPSTISTLQPEVNFTNTSYNAMPILWDFDDGKDTIIENPIHIFDDPGIYNVVLTVSDTNQCIDSISKKIIMYYDFVLYMPNSFSPTSAIQENTVFKPKGMRMKKYQSYQFIIYDNWGGTVFETDNINQGWNGKNAMGGSYAWIVIIKDELGKVRKKSGSVVLIR